MKGAISVLFGGLCAACSPHAQVSTAGAPANAPTRTRQVVLVHGFAENGSSFAWMKRRLGKQGFDCLVPRLTPRDGRGGLANLARQLKEDIDERFGPDSRIAVIAFSMGGIVSRYYLQELGGAERCDAFVTISSPHQGTAAAWCYPTQGAMEMRPGSDFLRQLEQTEHRLDGIPVVSYRTRFDLIILPPASSVWSRAENIEVPVLLHPLMLSCNRVITDIERRLLALPQ
jgi:triacylglycerol lipase